MLNIFNIALFSLKESFQSQFIFLGVLLSLILQIPTAFAALYRLLFYYSTYNFCCKFSCAMN